VIGARRMAPRRWTRPLVCSLLTTLAATLAGCGGSLDTGYSIDLIYPVRKDPLVLAPLPAETPANPVPPGKLDESIRRLPEIKGKLLDPDKLTDAQRADLKAALDAAFGRPAEPTIRVLGKVEDEEYADFVTEAPASFAALKLADPTVEPDDKQKAEKDQAYRDKTLAVGGKLFRRHCMHCHGVVGDGRGPSGAWLSPTPRDFRQGVFKFISCDPGLSRLKPRRDDLRRTLNHGVEGTSMPSFALLTEEERDHLVSYVLHLSIRGEVEYDTIKTLLDPNQGPDALTDKKLDRHVASRTGLFLWQWAQAATASGATPAEEPKATDPADAAFPASVRRGYQVFTGQDAGCISCHQDFGRQARYRYDDWGTLVKPNNLTNGIYRGGRRPIDMYYRLRCGIPGANMPKIDSKNFPDADVWALINFLRALPHPDTLPDDVREKVYGVVDPKAVAPKHAGGGHD